MNLPYSVNAETESGFSFDQEANLATLRAEIGIGLEQADRREFAAFTAEDIIAEEHARHSAATH